MILIAAVLLICVGLMHSVVGHKKLIAPLIKRDDLPIILGSLQNTKLTILVGWHITTLFWWVIAFALIWLRFDPVHLPQALLSATSAACAVSGLAALILSKGKHLSWVFFLPIAMFLMLAAINYA